MVNHSCRRVIPVFGLPVRQYADGGAIDEVEMLPEIEVRAKPVVENKVSRLSENVSTRPTSDPLGRLLSLEEVNVPVEEEEPVMGIVADSRYNPLNRLGVSRLNPVLTEQPSIPGRDVVEAEEELQPMKWLNPGAELQEDSLLEKPVKPTPEKELEPAKGLTQEELGPTTPMTIAKEKDSKKVEEDMSKVKDEDLSFDTGEMEARIEGETRKKLQEYIAEKAKVGKAPNIIDMEKAREVAERSVRREERLKVEENIRRAVQTLSTQKNPKLIRGMESGFNCIYNVLSAFNSAYHNTGKGQRPELSNEGFRRSHSQYGFDLIGNSRFKNGFYFDRRKSTHRNMVKIGDVLSYQDYGQWHHAVMVTGFDKDGEPLVSYSHGRPKNEDDYAVYDDEHRMTGKIVQEPTMVHNRRLSDTYVWKEDKEGIYGSPDGLRPSQKICVYRYKGNESRIQEFLKKINSAYKY